MYLLLAFAYRWRVWHTSPVVPFSTISNISKSVKRSNFTSVFFQAVCHANPGAARKQVHIIKDMYFEISQMQQLRIIYCFEHINHDIHLNLLFWNLYEQFFCVCNMHQYHILCLSNCKDLLFLVMMLLWIFPNHRCIHINKHLFEVIK